MAVASSAVANSSCARGELLQDQNVNTGKTRDLPIHDHVTQLAISEDRAEAEGINIAVTRESCLSPQVYDLVTRRDHVTQPVDYLDNHYTIDLTVMQQQFGADAVEQLDIVGGARKLHALAIAVHSKMSLFTAEQFNTTYHHYLTWTGMAMVFEDCYRQLVANEITAVHICYLLGAAALERALGNLYLTLSNARQCPSLLRDLLATDELQQCLGAEMMYCLQCLIGPPTGLNLRNLIWHGFPYPGEIPTEFGHLLLVLVATIGRILLQDKGEGLRHREYLTITHDDVIKEYSDALTADMTKDDLIGLIDKSHFVLPAKKLLWHKAIDEYYDGQYHISIPLLLSELEHAVRGVFVSVNNCPHRLLTAESTQLYTTFDEMMVRSLEDGSPNSLVEELGVPNMEMLLDLLVHPEGPRLRDRISHAEVNVYHLSPTMAAHVITVVMTLCVHYYTSTTNWSSNINNYCSLFHPLAIMRRELLALINALHPLYDVHPIDSKSIPVQEAIKCVGISIRGVAAVLQQRVIEGRAATHDVNGDSLDLHMIQLVIQEKWFQLINTLFVSRDILEITGILRRSIQHCHTAIQQVEAMLTLRREQVEKKMLRSRQRANFELLQESCVVYVDVSRLLVGMVMIVITRPHHHDHQKIIKSLKKMLQFTENFSSLTSPSKNRWDVVNSLCVEFANKITSLPLLIT